MAGTLAVGETPRRAFRMGEWLVEPRGDRVCRDGHEVHVRPRVMDLLVYLAGRSGEVVSKEELLDAVWATRIVAESALTSALAEMRRALGDDPRRPWLLETVPKRGYRLLPRPRPAGGDGPAAPEAPGASAPWAEGTAAVFVGRRGESERLRDALRAARAGSGRALFVAGEAGSGKTALLADFGRHILAEFPDVAVAGGRFPFREGSAGPFTAFRELLRVLSGEPDGGWLPRGPSGQSPDLAEWARVLTEVVPVHGPALPGTLLPGPGPSQPPVSEALSEQLTATLRAFSERLPLVLLLDDLHGASRCSVSLLYRLARRIDRTRILLVGAYRPEELARDGGIHPLGKAVSELVRYGGDAVLDLGDGGGRAFLDALVDSVPNRLDEDFRRELFAVTEGQPLLAIETLRELHARGALARDAAGLLVAAGAITWGGLPTRVEALVRERVEDLDPTARAVIEMAAVEGEEFLAELLAEALRAPLPRVVETLSGVLGRQRRLVSFPRPVTIGGRRYSLYRFRHSLFRRWVYESLDSARRSSRHDQLAEARRALQEVAAGGSDATLASRLEGGPKPAQAAPDRPARSRGIASSRR